MILVIALKILIVGARADYADSLSKIEGARADRELKSAQIDVAQADLERAKAVASLTEVVAPFDGVVVRRTVDPGSFVQNSTRGSSESLISVSRVDLVNVSAKFPDTTVSTISKETQALVTFDDIPGVAISRKISRYAPSAFNSDRTMRVEVDLFNGDESEYLGLVNTMKQGVELSQLKGGEKLIPHRVFSSGTPHPRHKLIPGMSGTMRLTLGRFGESYVLPKSAVYSRCGISFILMVVDGITREFPVQVQLSDGKTVRIALRQVKTTPHRAARTS